eukprot:6076301-Prymnesium_polylepis.1
MAPGGKLTNSVPDGKCTLPKQAVKNHSDTLGLQGVCFNVDTPSGGLRKGVDTGKWALTQACPNISKRFQ